MRMSGCRTIFKRCLLGAGVIFPLIFLIMEFRSGGCSQNFFGPIPTWMRIGLGLLMPASIFTPMMAWRYPKTLWMPAGDFLHGAGLLASFLYVLALGEMNVVGLLAPPVLLFLALSGHYEGDALTFWLIAPTLLGPLTALAAWYVIFLRFLRKLRKRRHALPWLCGMAFSLVVIIAAEWPMTGFDEDFLHEALQMVQGNVVEFSKELSRRQTPSR